jgi:diguanylate cyclase (GGDEF)-like protein
MKFLRASHTEGIEVTILIVESNHEDEESFVSAFKQGGYTQLLLAKNESEAFSTLGIGDNPTRQLPAYGIELIVLGSQMPEDSLETCRTIKDSLHYQDVPIIIASHGIPSDGTPMSIAYGALDYIRKPFNEYEFLSRIRSAIRLKHEIDRRKARERELLEATRQLYDLNSMLTKLSLIDSLTGIANRRNFDRLLEKEWRRSARSDHYISLIMIDIDFFKIYNDHYGHQGGDECLKNVARILKDAIQRPGDIVCRYGGEEFSVILPDTPKNGAFIVAEKLRSEVEKAAIPNKHSALNSVVTISVGVATIQPFDTLTPKDLIIAADRALYDAKKNGRNQVAIYKDKKPKKQRAG